MHAKHTLFFLLPLMFLAFTPAMQAQNWWKSGISGEGSSVRESLEVADFEAFSLNIPATLYVRQGNRQEVEIEAQQNIIDNVLTEVQGGQWKIKYDRPVRRAQNVTIWITVPHLTAAHISGSGEVLGEGMFSGLDAMEVSISGSGNINMGLEAKSLESSISGSGDIVLRGETDTHTIHISGSGDVSAFDMHAQDVDIHISGSGDVEVHADGKLNVSTSGSGDVYYAGRPQVRARVSGSGDVEPREGGDR